jgi:hypothetical protein
MEHFPVHVPFFIKGIMHARDIQFIGIHFLNYLD